MEKGSKNIAAITTTEIQAALQTILTSKLFVKAFRMNRLLRYLVEKAITGAVQDTSEYVIGIEVFDCRAKDYSTGENPIVRVQVGRLRKKLQVYYQDIGIHDEIEIVIETGCYMPTIQRRKAFNQQPIANGITIHPFKCISYHPHGEPFTQGLHEELKHQLFKRLGIIVTTHPAFTFGEVKQEASPPNSVANFEALHSLEGSVQLDTEHIRASIRLLDHAGRIAWSEQFNRAVGFEIALHEELAGEICGALTHFFVRKHNNCLLP